MKTTAAWLLTLYCHTTFRELMLLSYTAAQDMLLPQCPSPLDIAYTPACYSIYTMPNSHQLNPTAPSLYLPFKVTLGGQPKPTAGVRLRVHFHKATGLQHFCDQQKRCVVSVNVPHAQAAARRWICASLRQSPTDS